MRCVLCILTKEAVRGTTYPEVAVVNGYSLCYKHMREWVMGNEPSVMEFTMLKMLEWRAKETHVDAMDITTKDGIVIEAKPVKPMLAKVDVDIRTVSEADPVGKPDFIDGEGDPISLDTKPIGERLHRRRGRPPKGA